MSDSLPNFQNYVTISQAAKILGVSIDTLRRWDKNATLKSVRLDGKNRYYLKSDLKEFKKNKHLSISEAAAALSVSISTLRRLEERGVIIPERSLHGERLYDPTRVKEILEKRKKERKKTGFDLYTPASTPSFHPKVEVKNTTPIYPRLQPERKEEQEAAQNLSSSEQVNFYRSSSDFWKKYQFLNWFGHKNGKPHPVSEQFPHRIQKIDTKRYRYALVGLGAFIFLVSGLAAFAILQNATSKNQQILSGRTSDDSKTLTVVDRKGDVLAVTAGQPVLTINIQTLFNEDVTLDNKNLDIGTGELTASNVIYSITAGDGITITPGQNPIISADGAGVESLGGATGVITLGSNLSISNNVLTASSTSVNAFSTIDVGGTDIDAGTADTLTFSAGSGITLSADTSNKKITIAASSATSNWTLSGTSLYPDSTSYNVGIGNSSPTAKLDVTGNFVVSGTTSFNGVAYTWPGADGSNTYILQTNGSGTLSWIDPGTLPSSNSFTISSGAIYPNNPTLDFLVGGSSSASAKFGFINVNSGTPAIQINGTSVLTPTTLGVNVASSSLTSVGTLSSGAINTGFGIINTGNTITTSTTLTGGTVNSTGALQTGGTNRVDSSGNLTNIGTTQFNTVTYTWPSSGQSSGYALVTDGSGTLSWSGTGGFGTNYWTLANALIYPTNISVDFAIGGSASTSAKFAVLNVNSGTPTASLSAGSAGGAYLTADGTLQTTANQALTIGGSTTGNITLSPLNGSGTVNSTGDLNLSSGKAYQINGTSVLNATTLGSGVTTSSLTTVGALASGSIASGFGTIATANTITGTTLNGTTGINTGAGAGTNRIDSNGALSNITTISSTYFTTGASYLNLASGTSLQINSTAVIDSSRNLTNIGTTQFNTVTYTWPASDAAASNYVLVSNGAGTLSWLEPGQLPSVNYWDLGTGTISPKNSTVDLLLGASATTSAKFAFLNVAGGTPTASISANSNNYATYITGLGNIATTNMQNLTLGGSTTGTITLSPRNGSGTIVLDGTTTLNGVAYTWPGADGSNTYILQTNGSGSLSWADPGTLPSSNYFTIANGAIYPYNPTLDLFIGAYSTASAKFGFVNVNSGTPAIQISGTTVLTGDTLGSGVTASSLTSTGALASGSIASGFGTIATANTITGTTLNGTTGINTGAGAGTNRIDVNGNLANIGTTQFNTVTYTWPAADAGASGYALTSNGAGTLSWTDTAGFGTNYWTIASGSIYPYNPSLDLLIGSTASASAKFAILGVAADTPVASLSASDGTGAYLSYNGTLQTTKNAALTIGGSTTGNITLSPLNGSGTVTSTGDINLSSGKEYYINGTSVLNATTLGSNVITSSLTTVGALTSGSIASGFGTIAIANTITGTTLNGTTGINTGAGAGTQRIDSSGNILNIANFTSTGTTSLNGVTYTWPASATAGYVLTSGSTGASSTLSWTDAAGLGTNYFSLGTGTLYPTNTSLDFLIGNAASASAKFAVLNVNSGTPTASLSAGAAGGAYLTADGTLQTTANQTLAIGGSTTGNITLSPLGSSGTVTVNGALTSTGIVTANTYFTTGTTFLQNVNGLYKGASGRGGYRFGTLAGGGAYPLTIESGDGATYTGGSITFNVDGTQGLQVNSSGNVAFGGTTTLNGVTYTWPGADGSSAYILQTNGAGTLSWVSPTGGGIGTNYWSLGTGTIYPTNTSLDFLLGASSSTSAKFAFTGIAGGTPTASISANSNNIATYITGLGNLAATSMQGLTLGGSTTGDITFSPRGGSGTTIFNGTTTLNGVAYTWPVSDGSNTFILQTNGAGTLSWVDAQGGGIGTNYFSLGTGTLYPTNTSLDFLIGNAASASAKFAILNVAGGTPTASLSAGAAGGAYLTADGTLQTTANQTLTIGGSTTGNITLSPLNGSGTVTSTGDINLSSGKAYYINGTSVLNASTLGTGVTTSSLTTVGALTSGSIASGFGTIATANTITGTTLNGTTGINTGAGAGTSRIDSSGNLANIGTTQFNTVTYTWPGSDAGASGYALTSNGAGTLSWTDTAGFGTNYWTIASGALYPYNPSLDLLIGGTSTASADFAVLNVNGSSYATASVSGNLIVMPNTGLGGKVGIGTTSPTSELQINDTNGDSEAVINLGSTTGRIQLNGNNVLGANSVATAFSVNGSEKGRFTTTGLGVATTAPGKALEINSATGANLRLTYNDSDGSATNYTDFTTGSDGALTINTTGASVTISDPLIGSSTITGTTINGTTGINTGAGAGTQRIDSSGNILNIANFTSTGTTSLNGVTYTWPASATAGYVLTSGSTGATSTLSWTDTSSLGSNYFSIGSGLLYPTNTTLDFAVGGTASTSAKFAILGVNDNAPVASLSGSTGGVYLTAAGTLQTTANQDLTIGGSTTGNITLSPLNGSGTVTVNGTLAAKTGRGETITVAASNSNSIVRLQADYVADGAGGTDDATTIETAIAALPASGGSIVLLEGTYYLDSDIDIVKSNVSFSGSGKNTILLRQFDEASSLASGIVTIGDDGTTAVTNVTIANLYINGDKTTYTNANNHGILLREEISYSAIENVTITNGAGVGIQFDSASGEPVNYMTIRNNVISSNTGNGIDMNLYNSYNLVDGNVITGNADGINLTSSSSSAVGNTFTNNTLASNGADGIEINNTSYNRIANNNINNNTALGIYLSGSATNNAIANNSIDSNGSYGIRVHSSSANNAITGNNIRNNANFAVYLTGGTGNTVSGNNINANTSSGVYLGADYNTIASNNITANTNGVQCNSANYNQITSNYFYSNSSSAITMSSCSNNTISSNKLYDNGGSGNNHAIYLPIGSDSNIISDNDIKDSAGTGDAINILGSTNDNNVLSNNTFSGTGATTISDAGTGTVYNSQQTNSSLDYAYTGSGGRLGIGTTTPTSQLHVTRSSSLAKLGKALAIFDQTENQDLLTASASGTTRFRIANDGSIVLDSAAKTTLGGITYTWPDADAAGSGYALTSNGAGTLSWTNLSSGVNYFTTSSGLLYPTNATLDFAIGGTASTSAKFAVLNVNSGTPTASISANSGDYATYLTGDGTLAVTNRGNLTLGNSSTYDTTGNLLLNPNGTGFVGIGTTAPTSALDVRGGSICISDGGNCVNSAGDLVWDNSSGGSGFQFDYYNGKLYGGDSSGSDWNLLIDEANQAVGINTTAPGLALEVNSAAGNNLRLTYNDNDGSATNYTDFTLASDGDLTINSSGGLVTFSDAVVGDSTITGTTLNGTTGINTGAGAGTSRIDSSGNLANIGTISSTYLTTGASYVNLTSGTQLNVNGTAVIDSSRNLANIGTTQFNTVTYTWPASATAGYVLQSGSTGATSTLTWVDPGTLPGVFSLASGAVYPTNSTVDLLVGGTATTSAKFAFLGVASDSPVASISASNGTGLYLSYDGSIQTTKNANLTLGGATTGNIILSPFNNSGTVSIGTTSIISGADLQISATAVDQYFLTGNAQNTNLHFYENGTASMVLNYDGSGAGDANQIEFQDEAANPLLVIERGGHIGIGVDGPTAWLDIVAATTSEAQINLTSSAGTNPSAPVSGDLWWNGTNLYFYNGGSNVDLLSGGGGVTGSGTANTIAKFTDTSVVGNSNIYDDGLDIAANSGAGTSGASGTVGGAFSVKAGNGGDASTGNAGNGGAISLTTGSGGKNSSTTNSNGASGGAFTITLGAGGSGQYSSSAGFAGNGGAFTVTAGAGGQSENQTAGTGGGLTFTAGAGGAGVGGSGGAAGAFSFTSGAGGSSSLGNAGNGGNFTITLGAGGSNSSTANTNGGAGGSFSLTLGAGGTGRFSSSGGYGGAGGGFTVVAGNGGASGTSNVGGAGGGFTFNAGAGGINSGAGGAFSFTSGAGGNGGAAVGNGGNFTITLGAGGSNSSTTNTNGGAGGSFNLTLGAGGKGYFSSSYGAGGAGGGFTVVAGNGGASGTSGAGGNGGGFTFNAGAGGGNSGDGGAFSFTSGTGANGISLSGAGGDFTVTLGSGGSNSSINNTNGGNGGGVTFTLGHGGRGYYTSSYGAGGAGGSFIVTAGNGGVNGSSGTPGVAGSIQLTAGSGTTSGGNISIQSGNGSTDGTIDIGTNNSSAITIGMSGMTTSIGGNISVASFSTANTAGLCWDNSGASLIYDCNGAPTDLAEYFGATDSSVEAGDIVVADGNAVEVIVNGAPTSKAYVKKASASYQGDLLGVISTAPNQVYGDDGLFDGSENPRPVSLAGRVPVKVNTQNGPINRGDVITSSSTPGVGMKATKAGRVLGVALSSYNGSGTGKVVMYVNPQYYLGDKLYADTTSGFLDANGVLKTEFDGKVITADKIDQLIDEKVASGFSGIVPEINVQGIASLGVEGASQGSLKISSADSGSVLITSASSSANWTMTLPVDSGINGEVLVTDGLGNTSWVAPDVITSGLRSEVFGVLGTATDSAQTTTIFGRLAKIETEDLTDVNTKLSIFSLVTDPFGAISKAVFNVQIAFNNGVEFLQDIVLAGRIKHTDQDTAGIAVIKAGTTEVEITFDRPYEVTPIVNITANNGAASGFVKNATESGFTVAVPATPSADVQFTWSAVLIENPRISESGVTPTLTPAPTATPSPTLTPTPTP